MSLGVLAHCFGKLPCAKLAEKIGRSGFSYVQLALTKALSDFDCGPGKLSPGLANTIAEQFARHGVRIPVLGCYVNLLDSDRTQYRANIDRFKEHVRHARHFGAAIVATESGVPAPGTDFAQNWQRLKEAVEEIAEEAEKWGIIVGLEAANNHLIGSPAALAELLRQVPSSMLGVVFDPCNVLTKDNVAEQDLVMQEAFAQLGERMVSLHAKDVVVEKDGTLRIAAAGKGHLNYALFLKLANEYKPHIYITLERLAESEMAYSRDFIKKLRR
ncbi:MAG TPA: sugar phosphate isomerase/epimerase [Bacilli bacterium]